MAEILSFDPWKNPLTKERFSHFLRTTPNNKLQVIRFLLVQQLLEEGVITGKSIALDSCPIKANVKENNLKTSVKNRFDKTRIPKGDPDARLGVMVHYPKPFKPKIEYFWGYRRMTAWLNHREGYSVNRKRIYRLMRENKLLVQRKRYRAVRTSQRSKPRATRPNQFWGIDMTKFMLPGLGWSYLIVVLDWFTNKIVGWNVSLRARPAEWKEALERALCEEFPWGARDQGLKQIFCSYDNPKGNAETKRVIRTIKEELLWLNEFSSFEESREGIGN